jgi:hypothetical protein
VKYSDQVFLVFGSPVPLALRSLPSILNEILGYSVGQWCNLVGYAYVHGIMDGEAALKLEKGSGEGQKTDKKKQDHFKFTWCNVLKEFGYAFIIPCQCMSYYWELIVSMVVGHSSS